MYIVHTYTHLESRFKVILFGLQGLPQFPYGIFQFLFVLHEALEKKKTHYELVERSCFLQKTCQFLCTLVSREIFFRRDFHHFLRVFYNVCSPMRRCVSRRIHMWDVFEALCIKWFVLRRCVVFIYFWDFFFLGFVWGAVYHVICFKALCIIHFFWDFCFFWDLFEALCITWFVLRRCVLFWGAVCHDISIRGVCLEALCTEWQRPIGCLIFRGHFLQKSPIRSGSFANMTCILRYSLWVFAPLYHTAYFEARCIMYHDVVIQFVDPHSLVLGLWGGYA